MSASNYPTFDASDSEGRLYCANHPNVETYLRCGKCEKPICAKCRVSTPVGFRCFQCANLQSLPTYAVDTNYYLKATVAGSVVALATGVLMGLLPAFAFWVAFLMGIVVPEAVTRSANLKRGPGLQYVAMACVVLGFIISEVVLFYFPDLIPMNGINEPYPGGPFPVISGSPLYISQFTVIWLAIALFLANRRLK